MKIVRVARSYVGRLHADHRAIARSLVWIIAFALVGKIAGAAKEMVVAYRFGISESLDAYVFLLTLINVQVGLWFSVLTVILVPLAARIRNTSQHDLRSFRKELLGFSLLLAVGLFVLNSIGIPLLLESSWTGLPAKTKAVAAEIAPELVLLVPLGVVVSLHSAWMMSAERHINTLFECIPPLTLLIALLLIYDGGISVLVWGIILGVGLQLFGLVSSLARRSEISRPSLRRSSPYWGMFWSGFGIMLAGQLMMSLVTVIDQFFAARMGAGSIATLSYANRLLSLAMALGAMAVSRATLPVFSRQHALAHAGLHTRRMALRWASLLFVLGLAAALLGWLLSPWIVRLFFERGAFTADDTSAVVDVLRLGLMQLPFYFSALVLVSLATSQRRYLLIFWSGVSGLVVKLIANAMLVPIFDVGGLALAWAAVYAFNGLLFWLVLRRST